MTEIVRVSALLRKLGGIHDAEIPDDYTGTPRAILVNESNEKMRLEIFNELARIGEAAVTPLIAMAKVPGGGEALRALSMIGAPAVGPLIELLNDYDEMNRDDTWILRAVAGIQDIRAIEPLILALGSDRPGLWSYACRALARIGPPAVEPLVAILGSPTAHVRRWAAAALGWIGDARAVAALLPLLADSDAETCCVTATALGQIGDARAVESLLGLLGNPDENLRKVAITALGAIGDPRGLEPIAALLGNVAGCRTGERNESAEWWEKWWKETKPITKQSILKRRSRPI